MALANFSPSAYASVGAPWGTSVAVALPGGGGPTLLVTNMGSSPVVVLLGGSNVVVTAATGVMILPNTSLPLAVASNTYIAAMGTQAAAVLNLAQGT